MPKASDGDNRAADLKWGETKKLTGYMLTPTAKTLVADAATRMGTTSSEALEQLIRYAAPLAPNFPQACNS